MATTKYDFLNDTFTIFENVETPKVELKLPLFDDPIDISNWAYMKDGKIIAKGNESDDTQEAPKYSTITNDNTEETPIVISQFEPQSTSDYTNTTNTSSTSKKVTPNEWQKELTQAYKSLGLSDNAIRNLLAKNALESGWGKHVQGKYNYGNITTGKNWRGKSVYGNDKDENGNPIKQNFRSYDSVMQYAIDEIKFLTDLYDFNPNDDIDTFLDKLKGKNSGGRNYATSKTYKRDVKAVYNQIQI